jgi:alkylation response protein AidB-like acyl-CoA dehydrogenase
MPHYTAPLKDHRFLLHNVFPASDLSRTPLFQDSTPDILDAVLEEAAKFSEQVLAPLNRPGDEQGCTAANGVVTTPDGFPEAYRLFMEGGWAGLTASPEHGGQGLPHTLHILVDEMATSANPGFAMYRGLIDGAYNTILRHGSETLKRDYLALIATGETLPTMNLTEPHCGSDLGLLRTKAEPLADGAYRITGTKIFITGGEHDLTRNILHLVLARLPDAPEGSRGISLFLVPKYYVDPESGAEIRNDVTCGGIEHKMGLKASATCLMNYDGARGWLVGAPHSGLAAMFTMMNSARLGVGVQGVCAAEGAHQIAAAYAAERRQGKAPGSTGVGPDPIDRHPDVKRMLTTQKAFAQGGRALAVRVALALDFSHAAATEAERQAHEDRVQLLTPIVKAFLTDAGSEAANLALQTMGGHGYIREWGVEQWVRDIRIAAIYEGTNGIQALDLVGRKLSMKGGGAVERYFSDLSSLFERAQPLFPAAVEGEKALAVLVDATSLVTASGPIGRCEAASDYLTLFGLVALAGEWVEMAQVSAQLRTTDPVFHDDKIATADFYLRRILPRHLGHAAAVRAAINSAECR